MSRILTGLCLCLGVANSNIAYGDDLKVTSAIMAGSGCKANQKVETVVTDGAISWQQPSLEVDLDPTSRRLERRNCNLNINLKLPPHTQVSPISVGYHLKADIKKDVTADMNLRIHYNGNKGSVANSREIKGTFESSKQESLVLKEYWSPCGGDVGLTLNSSIRVKASGEGKKTRSAVKLDVKQLHLLIKSC